MSNEVMKPQVVSGAYSWIFTADKRASVFIGLPEEDLVKQEKVLGSTEWTSLASGMLAVISGRIDPGEDGIRTIEREALEEWRLTLTLAAISNSFPPVIVEQSARGRHIIINGVGHKLSITEEQKIWLENQTQVEVVPHEGLFLFLKENKGILRPFVYAVAYQILEQGLLYQE